VVLVSNPTSDEQKMANSMSSNKIGKSRKDGQRPLRRIDMGLRGYIGFNHPFHEIQNFRKPHWPNTVNPDHATICGQFLGDISQVSQNAIRKVSPN
jgi:hypothetical protein